MEEEAQLRALKNSLCRFYLRGICDKASKECEFAHGIDDLLYRPWQQGQHVEYDFQSNGVFCQKQSPCPMKNYINLYQFQQQPVYSQEEINSNRAVRLQIRSLFHRTLFKKFTQLLQAFFAGVLWTEDVLLREYTRVGFNKLMTRIHFSHLTSFLLEGENPLYFKSSVLMPPSTQRQSVYYIKRPSDQEILLRYKKAYGDIVNNYKELTADELKRKFISYPLGSISVPPLQIYLKQKKMTFRELLCILGQDEERKIQIKEILQPSFEALLAEAKKYIIDYGRNRVIVWNHLAHHLCSIYNLSKLGQATQLKARLCQEGYFYFHLPLINFIYHISLGDQLDVYKEGQCPCNLKQMFDLSFSASHLPTIDGEVFEIGSASQLQQLAPLFLNSSVVAVDLEGHLRRGGAVEMIQISNHSNIFLIDLLEMTNNNDQQSIQYTKKVLRNLMAGPAVKIFHDCRQDSLALHELLETCLVNVFDTSAMETVQTQHQRLKSALVCEKEDRLPKMKQAVQFCLANKPASLNTILIKYSSSHGPNTLKDYFHSQWQRGNTELSKERPLNSQFRSYCIMDVIDLVEVYHKMRKRVNSFVYGVGMRLSSMYAKACIKSCKVSNSQFKADESC